MVMLPWLIPLFTKLVDCISEKGSSWSAIKTIWKRPDAVKKAVVQKRSFKISRMDWEALWRQRSVLLLHCGITAIYAVGLLSAYYVAYLFPAHRMSLAGFFGVVNGFATIMMTLVLEPQLLPLQTGYTREKQITAI